MSELSESERDRRYYDTLNTKRRRDGLPPVTPGAGRASYSPRGPMALARSAPEKDTVIPSGRVGLDAVDPTILADIEEANAKLGGAPGWAEDIRPDLSTPEARTALLASMLFGQCKPREEVPVEVSAVAGEDVPYFPPEWVDQPGMAAR